MDVLNRSKLVFTKASQETYLHRHNLLLKRHHENVSIQNENI